jgi:hypothetical protein
MLKTFLIKNIKEKKNNKVSQYLLQNLPFQHPNGIQFQKFGIELLQNNRKKRF